MLACSLGAGVSGGGMVMDRLGGFRLCRRLLDPEEMLSPFLSSEAMLGERGQGRWNGNREGGAVVLRGGRTEGQRGQSRVSGWSQGRQPGQRIPCRKSVHT